MTGTPEEAPPAPSFDARAAVYDVLRPQDDAWWARFERTRPSRRAARARVLDVGCGTGVLAEALARQAAARVWGVEPSAGMAQIAKGRVPRAVGIRAGRAEALPFRDAWFDGVVFSLVIHLVERGPALAEAARVLVPGGRVVIATFAHEHFDVYWAARYFPSIGRSTGGGFPPGRSWLRS